MSKVVVKEKKTDFNLLRKLEDEYDEAVEDMESKEELLIKKVHSEYLKAERKGEFFDRLKHSESWYYDKFKEYNFSPEFGEKSRAISEQHQERKVQSIISDLDEMEEEIPILDNRTNTIY